VSDLFVRSQCLISWIRNECFTHL